MCYLHMFFNGVHDVTSHATIMHCEIGTEYLSCCREVCIYATFVVIRSNLKIQTFNALLSSLAPYDIKVQMQLDSCCQALLGNIH